MKRYTIICLLLIFTGLNVSGQKSYELSAPENTSKTYIARDYIRLLPGFSFNSTGGKIFSASINEYIVENAVYQTTSQLPNPGRSLNTSYAVGTIAGEAAVSPTGAAMYQIPITVMPGTGGMQPNISIAYNSQTGNGIAGYGWNLNALSAIVRTGKTIYHDGAAGAPQLSATDNLMMDGQRLMKAAGTNLAANSTYKTEIESYLEITCKTLNSYLGFEVKTKEGWIMEYGSSSDSYIKPKDESSAYAWLLKKVTDANGNYMTYTYDYNSGTGEFRLKQIDYTGNTAAGLNPYNKIEFFYETRTDKSVSHIVGKSIEQSVILKRIKCSAYNFMVNEYRFNYYYDGFYSKLTEVEEYGQNGERYNSTIVDWGDYYGSYSRHKNEYYPSLSDNKEGTYPVYADFNGDGKTDFISYADKNSYTSSDVATLYLATTSGGNISFSKKCTIPLISGFKKFYTGDFNGDGNMDVVQEYTQNNKFYYSFYTYNGSQFIKGNTIETGANGMVQTADYNGDGKDEIFFLSSSYYITVYDLNKTLITSYSFPKNYGNATSCENEILDFLKNHRLDINGNGKADILVSRTYSCSVPLYSMCDPCTKASRRWVEVYELNGNNNFVKIVDQNAPNSLYDGIPGDFNGDGKQDLLCRYDSVQTAIVDIYFSTGTSFEKKRFYNLEMTSGNPIVSVNDFNNDGKSDFVYFKDNGNNQHSTIIYTSTGENFISESYSSNVLIPSEVIQDTKKVNIGDFDGDGRNELIYSKWNYQCYIQTFNDKQNLLVKKIINGLNQQIFFEYKPITDNSYYSASTATFPVSKFQQPLYVITKFKNQAGNYNDSTLYYYKGAKIHRQGKGFLGFEEVTATNSQQNRKTTSQYGYNATYYNIYPVKQTVTTTSGDSISRTNYVSDYYTTSPAKVIFPYLKSQTTVDKLTGLISKTEYNYLSTNHGNPEKITETRGNLITETANTWEAKNSTFKNRITQQTITRKGAGNPFIETKKFAYDSKARLTQQIDYFGHPKAVTTNYTNHDSFGNPRTATTTATNSPTVTTSSTFDETGRFETTHTDALGSSSAVYNPRTGTLTEKTNIAGLKTCYSYDAFQKLKQETPPAGKIHYSTDWDNSGNNLYKTTAESQISGTQTTWYNAAGQEIKTQSQGFSGAVVSGKQYNSKGQLYRSYLPGYGNMSSQYIEYLYDMYGRILSENNLGRTTSYSYNGLTTTVTFPDGRTQSKTLNSSGLTQSSTDAAGNSVVYSYNSLGKPETITSNGLATHIRYDDRGFQRVLKDANFADSIRYEYNAYGQLASQTNARHQVTSFLYDAAGRITQQTRPENTLTYQYVSSGNGIGQIQYVKNAGQTVRTYAYTSLGQPSSVIERIDNTDYTDSYFYNSNGQMTFRATPSGMQIGYQYTNGILTSMRNTENNSLLWQADAINALGQITESTLGNGLKRTTGYDSYHLPNHIALKDGATFIDRVDYSFNSTTGNLTQRSDVTNSKNETFGYDNLNRLTSVALNAAAGNTTSYYPNGNINAKFDVGTYQYANNNHAVSGIANPATTYSPPGISIANTSFNRTSVLTQYGSAVVKKIVFEYNADNQRNQSWYYMNNALLKRTYYIGNYEKEILADGYVKEYDYICTPEGLSAIAVKANGSRSFYYVHTDHLGSVRAVTTASKGIQTRYYYDAWGRQALVAGTGITNRGYTGEEHLTDFGLINLNARLYDPAMGRFLEADPYVSLPDFTQAFNRYSYALNNPLKYTDPNGENPFLILAGFFFAKWFYDGYKANNSQWNPLKWDYSNANFMIGYSSNGNLFSFGSGWNNSYSLAFGYNSGSFSIGYLQDGVPHMTPVKWRRDEFVWDEKLYPTGVIRPHEPNFWERFRDDNIISRFTYEFLDMFWVYGTGAFSERGAYHLAGGSASGSEIQDAAVGTVLAFSPLSWAKGLSGGSSSAAKGGTTVYRAVDAAEKASINSSKQFLLKEGGTEFKYFAKSLKDAHQFGKYVYKGKYSIIQGTVNPSVNIGTYWYPTVDNMGAYIFPGNVLPYIKPIIP